MAKPLTELYYHVAFPLGHVSVRTAAWPHNAANRSGAKVTFERLMAMLNA